jgi:ribulose-phosphate 3-epimerase
MQITPAILEIDPAELKQKVSLVESAVDLIQIDVGDGQFIPATTVLPRALGEFRPLTGLEVHLMVKRPDRFLADWVHLGAKKASFHVEAEGDLERFIAQARELDCDITIALNPDTNYEKLLPFLDLVDEVMFLGVQPGAQGNPFVPAVLEAVKEFHKAFPNMPLAVDGGINQQNIRDLKVAGVARAIIGTTLWKSHDPVDMIQKLAKI